jgi:hypothetical protein
MGARYERRRRDGATQPLAHKPAWYTRLGFKWPPAWMMEDAMDVRVAVRVSPIPGSDLAGSSMELCQRVCSLVETRVGALLSSVRH